MIIVLPTAFVVTLIGWDFAISTFGFFLVGTQFAVFYTKGKTIGMLLTKIYPHNLNDKPLKLVKLSFYNFAISLCIAALFSGDSDLIYSYILPFVMITPWKSQNQFSSPLDLLFRLHWTEEENKIYSKSEDKLKLLEEENKSLKQQVDNLQQK